MGKCLWANFVWANVMEPLAQAPAGGAAGRDKKVQILKQFIMPIRFCPAVIAAYRSRMASSEDDERQSVRKTISCLLCGGVQIYPGPRYENHLVNEHGAVFDIDYLIQISLYKQQHGTLPKFVDSNESGNKPETKTVENGHLANVQTGRKDVAE
jgi:hypothetical protein